MRTHFRGAWAARSIAIVWSVVIAVPGAAQSERPPTAGALGLTRSSNPAIGVNVLLLGVATDAEEGVEEVPNELFNGLHFQEAEIGIAGAVDPYFRGDMTIAFEGTETVEVEEGYVTLLAMPKNFGMRAGKFFAPFGKHNQLHTHAWPFIDPPLPHFAFLGEHGLNDMGVEVNYLLPTPWYAEAAGYVLNGGEETLFNSPDDEDLAFGARLYNLVELADETTLELGASWAGGEGTCSAAAEDHGPGAAAETSAEEEGEDEHHLEELAARSCGNHVAGLDVTLQHLPASRRHIIWSTEYIYALRIDEGELADTSGGIASWVQYRVATRWWAQGRVDVLGIPTQEFSGALEEVGRQLEESGVDENPYRVTGLIAFIPTEFSAVRAQYSYYDNGVVQENRFMLQLNVTFGAHPAHSY